MRTVSADVAIVGGGIIGASTALFLQRMGKKAVVIEKNMLSFEASGRNGGGIRQQGRLLPEIPFAREAVKLWARLDELLGRPTGYRRIGNMFIAVDDAEMEMLAEQRARELTVGLESEMLDAAAIYELAPGLRPGWVGGKFCPTDGHAVPVQASVAIAEAAIEAGAEIVCHSAVDRIGVENGRVTYVQSPDVRVEAPVVLDAAGPWAPVISQLVDVYLPIFPSKTYGSCTDPVEYLAQPFTISAAWDFSLIQGTDGRVQFGGGAGRLDLSRFTFDKRINADYQGHLQRRAPEVFPALEGVPIRYAWSGIRECTPDMMPILGPVDGPEGFLVCAGFSGHGFALGPLAGQLMAEWIVDGKPSFDVSNFDYRRFLRQEGPLAVVQMALEMTG